MSEHPDRVTILMFVEDDSSIDRPAIATHLAACAECRTVLQECEEIVLLLSREDIRETFDLGEVDRTDARERLLAEAQAFEAEYQSADALLADLRQQPVESWKTFFDGHPDYHTRGMAERLFAEIEVELDRRPDYALALVNVAEKLGERLPKIHRLDVLGDASKHRANAFRHLGRYDDALEAAALAETYYRSLLTGDFDVAQAQYTRAVTLFKMTRYAEALEVLGIVITTLRDYGNTVPLAKALVLHAGILIEQGHVEEAQAGWRAVLPLLEKLGDSVEQARVLANLAECNLRLGAYDQAMEDARHAVVRYRTLGMTTECIRSEWTIGMIHLASGRSDEGIAALEKAARNFG